jgi:hypothetical protein
VRINDTTKNINELEKKRFIKAKNREALSRREVGRRRVQYIKVDIAQGWQIK